MSVHWSWCTMPTTVLDWVVTIGLGVVLGLVISVVLWLLFLREP
jgi:hypothetical protein